MAFDFSAGTVVPANNNQASTPAPNNNGSAPAGFDFNSGTPTNAGATPTITPPAAPAPAPATASGPTSLGGVADSVSGAINTGIDTAQNSIFSPLSWLGKVGGGIVGAAGGLIGGAVAGVANPIKNTLQGNPTFQNWGSDVAKNAAATAQFGYNIGDQGVKSAPFMGLGKVPGAVIGANQLYQGGKAIASGKYEDSVLPIITGLASLYGASQSTGSFINKGLPSDVNASGDVNVTPPTSGSAPLGAPIAPKGPGGLLVNDSFTNDANAAQNLNNAYKMMKVLPENMTKGKQLDAITSFKTTPGGLLSDGGIKPTDINTQIAQKYAPFFNSKNPIKVINNFGDGIDTVDKTVGNMLTKYNLQFTPSELNNSLAKSMQDTTGAMRNDPIYQNPGRVDNFVNNLIQKFTDNVPTKDDPSYNLKNLWAARKDFDQSIKKQLNAFSGNPSSKAQIATDMRNGVQDFIQNKIQSNLPAGQTAQYSTMMQSMKEMYAAVRTIAPKGLKVFNSTGLERGIESITSPIAGPVGNIIKQAFLHR